MKHKMADSWFWRTKRTSRQFSIHDTVPSCLSVRPATSLWLTAYL